MFSLLLAAGAAHAADIRSARYDPRSDSVVVDIAYRGTHPRHDFYVEWGRCEETIAPQRTVGRLIDRHGKDLARESYLVEERLSLDALPCRPAMVTLRLGRVSHVQVYVPREGRGPERRLQPQAASSSR